MADHQALFLALGICCFLLALLFCHAYDINNGYVYMPMCTFLGYRTSTYLVNKFFPTLYDPVPPPAPTTRLEKKKLARETHESNKREQRLARLESNANTTKKTD